MTWHRNILNLRIIDGQKWKLIFGLNASDYLCFSHFHGIAKNQNSQNIHLIYLTKKTHLSVQISFLNLSCFSCKIFQWLNKVVKRKRNDFDQKAQKSGFWNELSQFGSSLQFLLQKSSLPRSWPVLSQLSKILKLIKKDNNLIEVKTMF